MNDRQALTRFRSRIWQHLVTESLRQSRRLLRRVGDFMRSSDQSVVVRGTFPLKARASLVPVATSLLRCGGKVIKDMQHA